MVSTAASHRAMSGNCRFSSGVCARFCYHAPVMGTDAHKAVRFSLRALAALEERVNVEALRPSQVDPSVFDLSRMRSLLAALGNPHDSLVCIHVAGSKGKGSVCAMTASMLQGCGYAVGLYTSAWISESEFASLVERVLAAAASSESAGNPCTHFEVVTACALLHFAEQAVDFAVIETGMGGTWDATNVITPIISAITAIQGEHKKFLGDSLEAIASHKAGIIKPGKPVVALPQGESVLSVFREKARSCESPLTVVGEHNEFSQRFEHSPELGHHHRVNFSGKAIALEHVPVPLKGEHQAWNCGLVLSIADELASCGHSLPAAQLVSGLAATSSAGRLELAHAEPRVYLDGAHNPESIVAAIKALGAHVRYDSLVVVFGCATDKDIDAMLSSIAMGADKVIFSRAAGNARACDPKQLQRRFGELCNKQASVVEPVAEALRAAARAVARGDVVLVTGSFAIAGEAKAWLEERKRAASSAEIKPAPQAAKGRSQ
jgi:dihydrofolate synthase / folylpolyglutamate synthase